MTVSTESVNGIGPSAAKTLADHGIANAEELAAASVSELTAIPGFGEVRARQIIAAAADALTAPDTPTSAADVSSAPEAPTSAAQQPVKAENAGDDEGKRKKKKVKKSKKAKKKKTGKSKKDKKKGKKKSNQ